MSWTAFFNGILLIAALTTDSFVVSFSYGAQNVRLSLKMTLVMNFVMSILLAVGIWAGYIIEKFFPKTIALIAGALVLLGMGGYRMLRDPSGGSPFSGWSSCRPGDRTCTSPGRLSDPRCFSGRPADDGGRMESRKLLSAYFPERYFLDKRYLPDGPGSGNFM